MIIETILVILGVLTTILGIWNIIIGAYIWGGLFLVGGIWAIGLGLIYISQLRKERKKMNSTKNNLETSDIEFLGQENSFTIPDDGIQVESLFEEPVRASARSESSSKEEVKKPETKAVSESEPAATWRESATVSTEEKPVETAKVEVSENVEEKAVAKEEASDKSLEEVSAQNEISSEAENVNVESEPIEALNIVLIDEEITPEESEAKLATEEEIRDFEAESEKQEEITDEKTTDESENVIILEAAEEDVIEEEKIDYYSIVESTNQLVSIDESSMSLMISDSSAKEEE